MSAGKSLVALIVVFCFVCHVTSQQDSDKDSVEDVTQQAEENENNRLIFDDDLRLSGDNNIVIGENITIVGVANQISGDYARIEGAGAKIYGNYSTVIGNNARIWASTLKSDDDDGDSDEDDYDVKHNANVDGDNAFVVADDAIVDGNNAYIVGDDAHVTGNVVCVTGDDAVVCSDIGNQLEVTGSDVTIEVRKFNFDPKFSREYQNSQLYHTIYALTSGNRKNDHVINSVHVHGENATISSECDAKYDDLGVDNYDINIRGDDDVVVKVDGVIVKGSRVIKKGNRLQIRKS